ncbi:hypothetical protein PSPO01_15534 [Paraphaeosphaeria sporulosa]
MYDTADRLMAKYRKQALQEVDQITTSEQQQHQNQPKHDSPLRPANPKALATQTEPFAAATATHHKLSRKLERFVSRTPEKGDSAATRRPMGPERLSSPSPRTADSRAGGQMPGEDSWDWYGNLFCLRQTRCFDP